MSQSGVRGPLTRPRLGVLQQRILVELIEAKEENRRTQAALMGAVYDCAVWRGHQWLPMIGAQLMHERGDILGATHLLLRSLSPIQDAIEESLDAYLQAEMEPSDPGLLFATREALRQARMDTRQLRLLQGASENNLLSEQELYEMTAALARSVVWTAGMLGGGKELWQDLSHLSVHLIQEARVALATRQAAFSRALKLLAEHGLVERVDFGGRPARTILQLTATGRDLAHRA